jgi:hypothetical protein
MNEPLVKTEYNTSRGGATALARKLAEARRELVAEFERFHGLSRDEAIVRVRESETDDVAQQILALPLHATSWQNLDQLTAVDPELAVERWNAMVADGVEEVESGHRAAKALEAGGTQCHDRAQFLAGRQHLARDWQPRNGIELSLIDALALSQHMKLFWLQRMVALDTLETSEESISPVRLPTVTTFQAVEQAASMVDRFDRMFMRALRQLRDLRRYMPTVVVQHAEQVNVGEQQLNVTG